MKIIVTREIFDYTLQELWQKIKSVFAAKNHTHSMENVNGLAAELRGKQDVVSDLESIRSVTKQGAEYFSTMLSGILYNALPESIEIGTVFKVRMLGWYICISSGTYIQIPNLPNRKESITGPINSNGLNVFVVESPAQLNLLPYIGLSSGIYKLLSTPSIYTSPGCPFSDVMVDFEEYRFYVEYNSLRSGITEAEVIQAFDTFLQEHGYYDWTAPHYNISQGWDFPIYTGRFLSDITEDEVGEFILQYFASVQKYASIDHYRADTTAWLTVDNDILYLRLYNRCGVAHRNSDWQWKSLIPQKTSELANDSGFLTRHQSISHKQDRDDEDLLTEDKTIVGAINELQERIESGSQNGGAALRAPECDFTFRQRKWVRAANNVFCSDAMQETRLLWEVGLLQYSSGLETDGDTTVWLEVPTWMRGRIVLKGGDNGGGYPSPLLIEMSYSGDNAYRHQFRFENEGDRNLLYAYLGLDWDEDEISRIGVPVGAIFGSVSLTRLRVYVRLQPSKDSPKGPYLIHYSPNGSIKYRALGDSDVHVRKHHFTLHIRGGKVRKGEFDDSYRNEKPILRRYIRDGVKAIMKGQDMGGNMYREFLSGLWIRRRMGNRRKSSAEIYHDSGFRFRRTRWVYYPARGTEIENMRWHKGVLFLAWCPCRRDKKGDVLRWHRATNPRRGGGVIIRVFRDKKIHIRPITAGDIFVGHRTGSPYPEA